MIIRKNCVLAAVLVGSLVVACTFGAEADAKDIPLQKKFAFSFNLDQTTVGTLTYTVPSGRRLVIEFVSVLSEVFGTSRVLDAFPMVSIKTQTGSELIETYIQVGFAGSRHFEGTEPSDYRDFVSNNKMLLFADPESTVTIAFSILGPLFTAGDYGGGAVIISGYLVKP